MKTVGLAAAACVLLALATGCGADVMNSASAFGVSHTTAPAPVGEVPAEVTDRPAKFGERRTAGESLVVTVSAPKSFVPGDTAYPRALRAAAFEVAIENQGIQAYRPSQLLVKVSTLDGQIVLPVVDTAQGYTGTVGGSTEIPSGKGNRFTLAFAMPPEQVDLRVTIQPDAATPDARAEFEGVA